MDSACLNHTLFVFGANNADKYLDVAVSQMHSEPAVALNLQEIMDVNHLNTSCLHFCCPVLFSMALDKKYIDIKTGGIIALAVKNYSRYKSAMAGFVKAERYRDKGAVGRLSSAKMTVYQFLYDDVSALGRVSIFCPPMTRFAILMK